LEGRKTTWRERFEGVKRERKLWIRVAVESGSMPRPVAIGEKEHERIRNKNPFPFFGRHISFLLLSLSVSGFGGVLVLCQIFFPT
jgi:hypothetical protein